jgi:hypothetical protein
MMKKQYIQLWLQPDLGLKEELKLGADPEIRLRSVHFEKDGQNVQATLVEIEDDVADDMSNAKHYFRKIGALVSKLSFSYLYPFQVLHSRILPTNFEETDEVGFWFFSELPPGLSLSESKVGFTKTLLGINPSFLGKDMEEDVEMAIQWFITGFFNQNPVFKVMAYWVGIEMLSPEIAGPWRCQLCGEDMALCPHCNESTVSPKVMRSITDFLVKNLGMKKKEVSELYGIRCEISHGNMSLDPTKSSKASKAAIRLQNILLNGIKSKVGLPLDGPPFISEQGVTIVGSPGLHMVAKKSENKFERDVF